MVERSARQILTRRGGEERRGSVERQPDACVWGGGAGGSARRPARKGEREVSRWCQLARGRATARSKGLDDGSRLLRLRHGPSCTMSVFETKLVASASNVCSSSATGCLVWQISMPMQACKFRTGSSASARRDCAGERLHKEARCSREQLEQRGHCLLSAPRARKAKAESRSLPTATLERQPKSKRMVTLAQSSWRKAPRL